MLDLRPATVTRSIAYGYPAALSYFPARPGRAIRSEEPAHPGTVCDRVQVDAEDTHGRGADRNVSLGHGFFTAPHLPQRPRIVFVADQQQRQSVTSSPLLTKGIAVERVIRSLLIASYEYKERVISLDPLLLLSPVKASERIATAFLAVRCDVVSPRDVRLSRLL